LDKTAREPVYTIGVVADKLGISPETLRYYESEGLLLPHRTASGHRLFSNSDLEWISCFRREMTENKLNVAGVRLLLSLMPCWDMKGCTEVEQSNCPAHENYRIVCWLLDRPESMACQNDECRDCIVYLEACSAGKLEHIYVAKRTN
jgi:MerR family transcriptional regulator/heat shock protein HspR